MKRRERMSDLMTGTADSQIAEAVEAARESWDAGQLAHIYRPSALVELNGPGLSHAVDAIIRIGWHLHSTAMGARTVGPNAQQAMFVFLRK